MGTRRRRGTASHKPSNAVRIPVNIKSRIARIASIFAVTAAVLVPSVDAYAGNVLGPQSNVDEVEAYDTDVYKLTLEAHQDSRIIVRGDGDTDLDCVLKDAAGNVVATDTDSTDVCVLDVTPRWTGAFRLEIHNLGAVYNRYVVTTN
jgi:hypothetical protein